MHLKRFIGKSIINLHVPTFSDFISPYNFVRKIKCATKFRVLSYIVTYFYYFIICVFISVLFLVDNENYKKYITDICSSFDIVSLYLPPEKQI